MDTVLYVEDGEDDVLFMRRTWQKVGLRHLLQVVSSGQEAIAYLSGTGLFANRAVYPFPALILVDLKFPRMSGIETLTWLGGQEDGIRSLPVVILSSSPIDTDIAAARALGITDYWVKPAEPQKFQEMVTSLNSLLASTQSAST